MTWQSLTTNLLLVGIISNAAYYYLVGTQKCRKSMTSKLELFEQRWQTEMFKGIYKSFWQEPYFVNIKTMA